MELEIRVTSDNDYSKRFYLKGDLDTNTAPLLDLDVSRQVSEAVTRLVLDFSELEFLSSAGLRVIFKARKLMEARQGDLILMNMQPQVRRVFEIIKAAGSLSIFSSEQEFDDYLKHIQTNGGYSAAS